MTITAATSTGFAVPIVLTFLIAIHRMRTLLIDTASRAAFETEIAEIFLHFKSLEADRRMYTRVGRTTKSRQKAILIYLTKYLFNSIFVKILF